MSQTMYRSKASLEWAERIASAEGYLAAQYHLFDAVVNGAEEDTVVRRLDDVRRANSMFRSAQFLEADKAKASLVEDVDSGVEYLELLKQIKGNESRLEGWLSVVNEEQASTRSFLDLHLKSIAAPDSDVFVTDGESEDQLYDELVSRGYKRVMRWSDIENHDESGKLDLRKLQLVVNRFEALRDVKPGDVWYLNVESPEDQSKRAEAIHIELQRLYIPRNTAEVFAERWTLQSLANIPHFMSQGRDLEGLRDALRGSSALVVGAGPSVDDAIDWIKAQSPRPVIIAAYKALKSLIAAEIIPDLVVCLDPAQHARHLVGVDTARIAGFVAEVGMSSEVVQRLECPLFPFIGNMVSGEIAGCLGLNDEIAVVQSGGTVLSAALQAAVLVGCDEINFIGADFGFPDDRLYAVGAGTGDRFAIDSSKKSYVRKPLDANVRSGALIEVQANDGSTILSSVELTEFRRWVERFVGIVTRKNPETRFFNLSPKGAQIEGVPYVDMLSHRTKHFDQDISAVIAAAPRFSDKLLAKVVRRKDRQVVRLRELQAVCERAMKAKDKPGKTRDGRMIKLVSAAKKCPEISGLLSKQLINIEERRRQMNFESDSRLIELVIRSASACNEVLRAYEKYPTEAP